MCGDFFCLCFRVYIPFDSCQQWRILTHTNNSQSRRNHYVCSRLLVTMGSVDLIMLKTLRRAFPRACCISERLPIVCNGNFFHCKIRKQRKSIQKFNQGGNLVGLVERKCWLNIWKRKLTGLLVCIRIQITMQLKLILKQQLKKRAFVYKSSNKITG